MKVRIAIAGLVALAVLGACGKEAETTGGTVKPASSSETTVTTNTPTTATTEATTSTTAKPATTSTTAKPATTTTQKPATTSTTQKATTTTTAATKTVSYANCSEVKAAGAAPIHRGEPGYSTKLDRDGDGIACEK